MSDNRVGDLWVVLFFWGTPKRKRFVRSLYACYDCDDYYSRVRIFYIIPLVGGGVEFHTRVKDTKDRATTSIPFTVATRGFVSHTVK